MASDEVRKKWGTIFMGEREATAEQLDAMQEPMRRERMQQQEQENYLGRVRAKAEQRAREILGAAYAERQRVLDEAGAEARAARADLTREAEALQADARAARAQAAAELSRAEALRREAEETRDAAHSEGFQAGMEQAGAELKEFRAELGHSLAALLRALNAQRESICAAWREELAGLTLAAVEAGTGWLLENEHRRVLRSLVLEALNLLEDRATVTVRVHPGDEGTVGDMFSAARERAPELRQWIVSGDTSLERGGLVAESVSGSVDCRREHYRELVDSILRHLTLSPDAVETRHGEEMDALVEREAERMAALAPDPAAAPDASHGHEPAPESGQESGPRPDEFSGASPGAALEAEPGPAQAPGRMPEDMPGGMPEEEMPGDGTTAVAPAMAVSSASGHDAGEAEPAVHETPPGSPLPEPSPEPVAGHWIPPLGEEAPEGVRPASVPASKADPSLAELEDELFAEEEDAAARQVFTQGGFLPGTGDGR